MPLSDQSLSISAGSGTDFLPTNSRPLCLLILLAWLSGCAKSKETPVCLDRRERAREAASQGNLDRASNLLEEARAKCSQKSEYDIRRLEKLVAEKLELQLEVRRREQERRDQIARVPAKRFVSWVMEERDGVSNNAIDVTCAEPGSSAFGFCEARHPGSAEMTLRYWEAQKSAFRYSFSTVSPLSCQDLGDHRRVRSWTREQTTYELCELTEHELRSLSALLVRTETGTSMHVFSYAYVQKDKHFERLLQGKR